MGLSEAKLTALTQAVGSLAARGPVADAIARWRANAAALRFHLHDRSRAKPIIVILGGTGTGKSTIINRLLGALVTAASFRRTFTAGPIAIAESKNDIPADWLELPHENPTGLPARGAADQLMIVEHPSDLTSHITLVDTPDLDGDQPAHHAQADRAFRWAEAIVFLVTPEKYQMTELLGYYRLAQRYALPALFVMNKVEQQPAVDDYAQQLAGLDFPTAPVFAIARDDSTFQPEGARDLSSLAQTLSNPPATKSPHREEGLKNRARDLLDRLTDQIIEPLQQQRKEADRLASSLVAMEAPQPGVDVNPLTRQLARRLQQRSILYLMGPQRVLDRVRQVPSLLVRLPRTAWDWVMTGKADLSALNELNGKDAREVPDFQAALVDQFSVLQTRIDDALRSSALATQWIDLDSAAYSQAKFDPHRAGRIADEELADLKDWLTKRWNATPRDTALLLKVIRHLPGGDKLTQWSEAAPYLLAIVVATHHAFFGHIDLMILGGYSLAAWLMERLSNEVASRTRLANRRIAMRFEQLAHEQINAMCAWLKAQAPASDAIARVRKLSETLAVE